MFRIFRKLRQSLLAQGRIGRYLSYAVGEIVLVVAGILIAVQINNWNEARKNKIIERAFIESFVTDLHEDLTLMDKVKEFNEMKIARLDSLLAFAGTDINAIGDQNRLYYLMRMTIANQSIFLNQDRSLNKMANLASGIIRPLVADSIALFQRNALRIHQQGEAYTKSILDARAVAVKVFKFYLFANPDYRDPNTDKFTDKLFPPISTDVSLQDEFFNAVFICRGVTNRYLADTHLAGHYEKTKRLIDFLVKEYNLSENAPEESR